MSIPKIIVKKTPYVLTTTPRDDTHAAHASIQHIRTSLAEATEPRSASATSRFRPTPLFAFGRSVPLPTTAAAGGGTHHSVAASTPSPRGASLPPSPHPQAQHHAISSSDVSTVQEQLLMATQAHVEALTREKHELERQVMALVADAAQRSAHVSQQEQQRQRHDEATAAADTTRVSCWMVERSAVEAMRHALNALLQSDEQRGASHRSSPLRDLQKALTKALQAHHHAVKAMDGEEDRVPLDTDCIEALVAMPHIAASLVDTVRQATTANDAAAAALRASQEEVAELQRDKQAFCARLEALIARYEAAHQQLRVEMEAERQKSRQLADALAVATAATTAAQQEAAKQHQQPTAVPGSPLRRTEADIAELAELVDRLQHRAAAAGPPPSAVPSITAAKTATMASDFTSQFQTTMQSIAAATVQTDAALVQLTAARKANIQRMLKAVTEHKDRHKHRDDQSAATDAMDSADAIGAQHRQQLTVQYERQLETLQQRMGEAESRLQADRLASQESVERLHAELEASTQANKQLQTLVLRLQDQAMSDHDEMDTLQRQLEKLESASPLHASVPPPPPAPATRIPALVLEPRIVDTPPLILDPSELTWAFDVLGREAELTAAGGTLYQVGCAVATSADIFDDGAVDGEGLKRLLLQLQRGYEDTPYHCVHHAADMTHAAFYMLRATGVLAAMDSVERAAALVACAGHDHQHPGRNNAFMIAVGDPVAARYNDQAVLENHHLASTYGLLERPEFNVLARLAPQDAKRFRQYVVRIILNTDMAQHIPHLAAFEARHSSKPFELSSAADRLELVCQLVHAADISSVARPFRVGEPWSLRVQAEFRAQGDEEAALGLPVSFGCGPDVDLPPSQVGFIDTFVAPLFRALARQFPQGLGPIVQTLSETRAECVRRCTTPPPPPVLETPPNGRCTVNPVPLYDELSLLLNENIELREALHSVVAAVGKEQ